MPKKPLVLASKHKNINKTPRLVNLAEVAKALEQIKAVVEEQPDDELFVFDKHGNKVLL